MGSLDDLFTAGSGREVRILGAFTLEPRARSPAPPTTGPQVPAGQARWTPAEGRTMRFDLLHEHDRFIPGWHDRPEPASIHAEFGRPEWRWPSRLYRAVQASLDSLIEECRAAL